MPPSRCHTAWKAINFTLDHKEVKKVKKFVPASKDGPAINFTLHLKSVRTVKRYLPAQELKAKISEPDPEVNVEIKENEVEQKIKVEDEEKMKIYKHRADEFVRRGSSGAWGVPG
ncbi:hypothetical protein SLS61_007600 [Didymella pomorum]